MKATLIVMESGADHVEAKALIEKLMSCETLQNWRGDRPGTPSGEIKWRQAQTLPQWKVNFPVDVGVLDTGFNHAHPQLTSPTYKQHLTPSGNRPDAMGHGTHVCGQLVATHNATNGFEGLVGDCARVAMHCGLSEPYNSVPYYQGLLAACAARLINLSVGGEQQDLLETNIINDALARDARY